MLRLWKVCHQMEIGVSSASFYPLETEFAVSELIKLGFHKTELFLNSESEFDPTYCKNLRKILDSACVSVVSVHAYTAAVEGIYFFGDYPRRTADSIEAYRKYFRAAEILGAKYFTFHGDRTLTGKRSIHQTPIDRHSEVLLRLADAAKEHGILIAQENVSWCTSADPEYIRGLRRNLGDAIGYTLDLKQARRANTPWQDYADAMGDRIVNLHISDVKGDKTSILPGRGDFDYIEFYQFLKKIGYSGDSIIEVYREDYNQFFELVDAKRYVESVFCEK